MVKTTSRETRGTAASNARCPRLPSACESLPAPQTRCALRSDGARREKSPGLSARAIRRRPAAIPGECGCGKSPPYRREVSSRSSGALPSTSESSRRRSRRPTFTRQTLARIRPLRVSISTTTGRPSLPIATSIGIWLTSVFKIFFPLPSAEIEPLAEISLAIKQANADQRNIQVGGALDVIAGQHAQAAGVNRAAIRACRTRPKNRPRDAAAARRRAARPRSGRLPDTPACGDRRSSRGCAASALPRGFPVSPAESQLSSATGL